MASFPLGDTVDGALANNTYAHYSEQPNMHRALPSKAFQQTAQPLDDGRRSSTGGWAG